MDKYGLIGYPLVHSFSISYFNQKFIDEKIDAVYENFEIPTIDLLPEVIDSNPDLRGLNVTIPYKQKVMPFLDAISQEAMAIGAVNVIKVTREGGKSRLKMREPSSGGTGSRLNTASIRFTCTIVKSTVYKNHQKNVSGAR